MKVFFPLTNRAHIARQKLLIQEAKQHFDVQDYYFESVLPLMHQRAMETTNHFGYMMDHLNPDAVVLRGDRFEILPIAMLAAYHGKKLFHIEAGDLSGVIDNKVRFAVSHLADVHFATNPDSKARLIGMGLTNVFDVGSLDAEFALSVPPVRLIDEPYIVVCFHPIPGENGDIVRDVVNRINGYRIVDIASNRDYGMMYPGESYSPEDYINLLRYASFLVGNSSSFLKEASVLGTPAINIGDRQANRSMPNTVTSVPYKITPIQNVIDQFALRYFVSQDSVIRKPDYFYYKEGASNSIIEIIKKYV